MPLRERAIALLKQGRTAGELEAMFVSEGAEPSDVRAVLTELVALQRQARALDPRRLRHEALWMYQRGASVDDVATHFIQAGVAESFARPNDFVQQQSYPSSWQRRGSGRA